MVDKATFILGGSYANRNGEYTVQRIDGPRMTIQYTDGTTQGVTVEGAERIWRNIESERSRSLPSSVPPEGAGRFFNSVGYLAGHLTGIEVFVPPQSRNGFELQYREYCGERPVQGINGYVVHPTATDKWGAEMRISFTAPDKVLGDLFLGPEAKIVDSPIPDVHRVNNNSLIWRLFKMGFRLGAHQNLATIRSSIPTKYRGDFDAGVAS